MYTSHKYSYLRFKNSNFEMDMVSGSALRRQQRCAARVHPQSVHCASFFVENMTLLLVENISRMPKQSKKSDKKHARHGSDDEFALDLVDYDAPKAKSSRKVIDDSDVDGVDVHDSAQPISKEPVTYPCNSCHLQLLAEVKAKLQTRTLSSKASETLRMLPYFTDEELVDSIVDLFSVPSSGSAGVTSPAPKVHIGDSDRSWQVMKFPDIGFFAGTTLEKTVEAWMIPKVPVLYNTTTGIAGCANCKLQSVASVSGVSAICVDTLCLSDTCSQETLLCPGRGAFMSIVEAKSKGCLAIINKQFFDFVCSKQDEIADYTSQKMAKADAPDTLQQRLNAVMDRLSNKPR